MVSHGTLILVVDYLYRALNEADDIQEYLKEHPFGDITNADDQSGYRSTANMLSHPKVDMESLYNHKTLGWLFAEN